MTKPWRGPTLAIQAASGSSPKRRALAEAATGEIGHHRAAIFMPSLLLVEPGPRERAPELGFVAGVALAETLHAILGYDPRLTLKWPNDLVFDGAKLSGLLLEATTTPEGHFACVIGFGVNCASHPQGLAYPTTDLSALGRQCVASRRSSLPLSRGNGSAGWLRPLVARTALIFAADTKKLGWRQAAGHVGWHLIARLLPQWRTASRASSERSTRPAVSLSRPSRGA